MKDKGMMDMSRLSDEAGNGAFIVGNFWEIRISFGYI
jgi:hypothetical protein